MTVLPRRLPRSHYMYTYVNSYYSRRTEYVLLAAAESSFSAASPCAGRSYDNARTRVFPAAGRDALHIPRRKYLQAKELRKSAYRGAGRCYRQGRLPRHDQQGNHSQLGVGQHARRVGFASVISAFDRALRQSLLELPYAFVGDLRVVKFQPPKLRQGLEVF